ncbi:MAG: hypothetical protein Q4B63_09950 [Clostridium perfringens]|nr:hypothetical protein [Clostridium perfringens]
MRMKKVCNTKGCEAILKHYGEEYYLLRIERKLEELRQCISERYVDDFMDKMLDVELGLYILKQMEFFDEEKYEILKNYRVNRHLEIINFEINKKRTKMIHKKDLKALRIGEKVVLQPLVEKYESEKSKVVRVLKKGICNRRPYVVVEGEGNVWTLPDDMEICNFYRL